MKYGNSNYTQISYAQAVFGHKLTSHDYQQALDIKDHEGTALRAVSEDGTGVELSFDAIEFQDTVEKRLT